MGGVLAWQDILWEVAQNGLITDEPRFGDQVFWDCFQPASYDLRVGKVITEKEVIQEPGTYFRLQPGGMCTIETLERVRLPQYLAGTVFPPNYLSLRGVLVLNPGHIDPGYEGHLTARIVNFRKNDYAIQIGATRVLTLIFQDLRVPTLLQYPRPASDVERTQTLVREAAETMRETIFRLQQTDLEDWLRMKAEDLRREFGRDYLSKAGFSSALWGNIWKVVGYTSPIAVGVITIANWGSVKPVLVQVFTPDFWSILLRLLALVGSFVLLRSAIGQSRRAWNWFERTRGYLWLRRIFYGQ